jgi:hypothetical protein
MASPFLSQSHCSNAMDRWNTSYDVRRTEVKTVVMSPVLQPGLQTTPFAPLAPCDPRRSNWHLTSDPAIQ